MCVPSQSHGNGREEGNSLVQVVIKGSHLTFEGTHMIGKYMTSLDECPAVPVSSRAMATVLLVEVRLPLGVWLGLVVHWPGVVVRQQEPTRNPSLRFQNGGAAQLRSTQGRYRIHLVGAGF